MEPAPNPPRHEETEISLLRYIERITRSFVDYVDEKTEQAVGRGNDVSPFAPRTVEMVESVRVLHARVDQQRAAISQQSSES